MSVKEIDNENVMKANAAGSNGYKIRTTQIHSDKYIEHVSRQQQA